LLILDKWLATKTLMPIFQGYGTGGTRFNGGSHSSSLLPDKAWNKLTASKTDPAFRHVFITAASQFFWSLILATKQLLQVDVQRTRFVHSHVVDDVLGGA